MKPIHESIPPALANWVPCLIDCWRELRAEREARREAEHDRDAYREIARETIHALAELTQKHRRQTARLTALLNERQDVRRAA